jgi:hypothetical protein
VSSFKDFVVEIERFFSVEQKPCAVIYFFGLNISFSSLKTLLMFGENQSHAV